MIDLTTWALTSAILFASGYLLGMTFEKRRAIRFVNKIVEGCALYIETGGDIKKLMKKEKNAKHAGRV